MYACKHACMHIAIACTNMHAATAGYKFNDRIYKFIASHWFTATVTVMYTTTMLFCTLAVVLMLGTTVQPLTLSKLEEKFNSLEQKFTTLEQRESNSETKITGM